MLEVDFYKQAGGSGGHGFTIYNHSPIMILAQSAVFTSEEEALQAWRDLQIALLAADFKVTDKDGKVIS